MTTHLFTAVTWHNVLGTLPPAFTVASGDTVITETIDAHGFDKDGVQRAPEPNPLNGPIFVTGAEPGDALKVEILCMMPIRATGWTRASLAGNVVDPEFVVCYDAGNVYDPAFTMACRIDKRWLPKRDSRSRTAIGD